MTSLQFRFAMLLAFWAGAATAQVDTLRIATYNLLKFPYNNAAGRIPHFRTVINSLKPDVLVVQELQSAQGLSTFLQQVMNYGRSQVYQNAPYMDGRDTDNGLFFKQNKISLVSAQQIKTSLRDISEYVLRANGVNFLVYSVHLKAGSTPGDENQRATEATILRNYLNGLPANFNFIVAGDFNTYRSTEPGFTTLTETQADNDGQLWDPLNAVGIWNNNGAFAAIHTQSTRTALIDSGATGGLDDRFDMLLVSASLLAKGGMDLLPGTYRAFGNDGRHFNQAINFGTNTAVPDSVANALHFASDHLPVYADFVIETTSAVANATPSALPPGFRLEQNQPNPFLATGQTEIRFSLPTEASAHLEILNFLGQRVALLFDGKLLAGEHRINWSGRDDNGRPVAGGIYFYRLQAANAFSPWQIVKKMVVLQ